MVEKNNIDENCNDIIVPNPSVEMETDASLNGWLLQWPV